MIEKIKNSFKNIDSINLKIIKKGLKISFLIMLFALLILVCYITSSKSLFTYYIGISLFKTSLYFGIEFIICGIVIDSIKKGIA